MYFFTQHGDIFTIQAAGKWMTFILDPDMYHNFFTSNSVDFQAAVLPICNKVGKFLHHFVMVHS